MTAAITNMAALCMVGRLPKYKKSAFRRLPYQI